MPTPNANPHFCLFCSSAGPFTTQEHIVPESLGNKDEIVVDLICDTCQNYFGREIEAPALSKTPIGVWRTHLGITTKSGKHPKSDLGPPKNPASFGKGAVWKPAFGLESKDTHVNIDFHQGSNLVDHGNGRLSLNVELSPWVLSMMTRLLGKMGLEKLAVLNREDAFSSEYDEIRRYVRFGSNSKLWPLFWTQHGDIADLTNVRTEGNKVVIETKTYSHGILESLDGPFYLFSIGIDYYLIFLTNRKTDCGIRLFDPNVDIPCVWYPDGSWLR